VGAVAGSVVAAVGSVVAADSAVGVVVGVAAYAELAEGGA
jgi:hypothetical protein